MVACCWRYPRQADNRIREINSRIVGSTKRRRRGSGGGQESQRSVFGRTQRRSLSDQKGSVAFGSRLKELWDAKEEE